MVNDNLNGNLSGSLNGNPNGNLNGNLNGHRDHDRAGCSKDTRVLIGDKENDNRQEVDDDLHEGGNCLKDVQFSSTGDTKAKTPIK